MKVYKSICITLFSIIILIFNTQLAQAHSGRTNSEGCHNNHSTGSYHCHNGGSSSDYQYRDYDNNGENDYDQNRKELLANIKDLGKSGGKWDANFGNYKPTEDTDELSYEESNMYKSGYDEGYQQEKEKIIELAYSEGYKDGRYHDSAEIPSKYKDLLEYEQSYKKGLNEGKQFAQLAEEALDAGYQLGLKTDNEKIPDQYKNDYNIKKFFSSGFRNGQIEKWKPLAVEKANKFNELQLPEDMQTYVKNKILSIYNQRIDINKEEAFNTGYTAAFKRETMIIPEKYETNSVLKEQFQKGFEDNTEINKYISEAYESGKMRQDMVIPVSVKENGAEQIYEKYFNKGKKEASEELWFNFFIVIGNVVLIAFIYRLVKKYNIFKKIMRNKLTRNYYTSKEAADKFKVSEQTVKRMCSGNKFHGAYKTSSGKWIIPKSSLK